MSDAADLARRFLRLWEEYLAALLSNPAEAEVLQSWAQAATAPPGKRPPHDAAPGGPAAGTASIAGSSGERDELVAELSSRIAELEGRVAAIERNGRAAPQSRRRN